MASKNYVSHKKLVNQLLLEPTPKAGTLLSVVKQTLKKRTSILALTKKYDTPFYVFDTKETQKSINELKQAIKKYLPGCEIYYAVKTNDHDLLLKEIVKNHLDLDVSSGREMELALKHNSRHIIFSGPAKSDTELKLAISNKDKTIIHLDSFEELRRLGQVLSSKQTIRAGVRIATSHHGKWSKFGIPLNDLSRFWREAKKYPNIHLQGLQCHISFNRSALPYQEMIKEISAYLRKNFSPSELKEIKFFDFGGGFSSSGVEAEYPWITPQGHVVQIAHDYYQKKPVFKDKYYPITAIPIEEFIKEISKTLKQYLEPIVKCRYMCEPGRILAERSMHIVLRIKDLKSDGFGIADGGINLIGTWEKYEDYYSPAINLTHPSLKEKKFTLYGNLCTPYDIWGYYCYSSNIKQGDVILIPFQGAYTYALANDFIKPIAPTYKI